MDLPLMILLDLVAVAALTFGLYFPRHRRRDMVVAYLVVNVGLLAVTIALSAAGASPALGFGLFAVLSIIRLRSAELDQPEIAYYFASMTLGLLGGLALTPAWLASTLMLGVLFALFVGDHPRLFGRYRVHVMTLDAAYTEEDELIVRLEQLLRARVHRVAVRRIDLVEATTVVEVRYERPHLAERSAKTIVATGGEP
ncbi:MAG: DUF4956 domain-containing protein [Chloroflexi bacterium]|nr:DUF4956 domain-containing protein [Chloroflexota bacterium]